MWTTQVVLSLLMVLVALTSYLKADHFTVGPKGAIVRAASSTITKQTTEEEKIYNDPTSFFGSSSRPPSTGGSPLPPQNKQKSHGAQKGGTVSSDTGAAGHRTTEDQKRRATDLKRKEEAAAAAAAATAGEETDGTDGTDATDATDGQEGADDEGQEQDEQTHTKTSTDPKDRVVDTGLGQGGIFSMTSLSATSAFYLTRGGDLMERFFNGYKWVYHAHPPPLRKVGLSQPCPAFGWWRTVKRRCFTSGTCTPATWRANCTERRRDAISIICWGTERGTMPWSGMTFHGRTTECLRVES